MLVTSRTSSWVVQPPNLVFYKDALKYAPKGRIARAQRVLSRRPSAESSTGFGGGFDATGWFVCVRAHRNRGARGLPRRRGWAQSGRQSHVQDKSLRVGGFVDEGWGLQPERKQGPLRTLKGLQQHTTAIGEKQEQPRGGVVSPASRRARRLSPSPWPRISVESCIRGRNLIHVCCRQGVHRKAPHGIG